MANGKWQMPVRAGQGAASMPAGRGSARHCQRTSAFTLLEVIVACTIFFMVAFAVLELVTRSLAMARSLQEKEPDAGILAESLTLTNQLEEGTDSGDFEDLYPKLYKDYRWERNVTEIGSNGLFQVDFIVYRDAAGKGTKPTTMSILMFRPGSKPGSATKGRP